MLVSADSIRTPDGAAGTISIIPTVAVVAGLLAVLLDMFFVALVLIEQPFTFALAVFATVLTQDLSETLSLFAFFTIDGTILETSNSVFCL